MKNFDKTHSIIRCPLIPDKNILLMQIHQLFTQLFLKVFKMCSTSEELEEIRVKKYIKGMGAYSTINGTIMELHYKERKTTVDEWMVNEEDVWICSFPKTGTTWTQEMVWMIMNGLDFEEGKKSLWDRSPFFEFTALVDYHDDMVENPDVEVPLSIKDSFGYMKTLKSPICVKTHLPWNLLPQELQNGTKKPKMIYVTRNPKDTCTSYYHHAKLLEGFIGDLHEFCELFLGDKVNYGPFWRHVLPFWALRHRPNILFLKYEDMKRDLPLVIRETARFLEKSLNEEQVNILEKHLSFESMKVNRAVNFEPAVELNKKLKIFENINGSFLRSGTVGSYKNEMDQKMVKRFDEWERRNLIGTDYNL